MISRLAAAAVATVLLLAGSPASAAERPPQITGLSVVAAGGAYVASGELTLWLTKEVKETIDASLPVTVRYRAELFSRGPLWSRVVAGTTVTKTLRYDRVKESFLLGEAVAGQAPHTVEATNAAEAQRWFSTAAGLSLKPVGPLPPDRRYRVRLRAEIEVSRRSFPLNLLLFFVPDRNKETEWAVSPPILVSGGGRL